MKLLMACAVILTLLFSAGCREATPPKTAGSVVFDANRTGGLVWKVSGGSVPVFLAGSMHLLQPGDLPYPGVYELAYGQSNEVWFEIAPGQTTDTPSKRVDPDSLKLPPGRTLHETVSPETWLKVRSAGQFSTKGQAWQKLKPWAVAVDVAMEGYRAIGARADLGLDKALQKLVLRDGRPSGGFETTAEQIQLMSGMTPDQSETFLVESLTEAEKGPTLANSLLNAWRKGDEAALGALQDEGFAKFPDLKERLVLERNRNWLPKIEKLCRGERPAMVVVGCGHLCGNGSLLELLRGKKFHVERIVIEGDRRTN